MIDHPRRAGRISNGVHGLRAISGYLLLIMLPLFAPKAWGAPDLDRSLDFHIPSQAMDEALLEFSRQSGVPVSVNAQVIDQLIAPPVYGHLAVNTALGMLLYRTRMDYESVGEGVSIYPEPSTLSPTYTFHTSIGAPDFQSGEMPPEATTQSVEKSENKTKKTKSADSGEELQEVVVTGTHIRGVEPAAPLISISSLDIEKSGYVAVGDVIRSLPENFSGGNNPQVQVGAAPGGGRDYNSLAGGSAPNLRGLGAGSTLTLIDGHRLAQDESYGAIDVTLIPILAIDRIDVVTDGASAIYGSDAVAGVVNFILKKDYQGAQTTAAWNKDTQGGGFERQVSQLAGTSWEKGSVVFAYEHDSQDAVYSTQRTFTSTVQAPYTLLPDTERNSGYLYAHQAMGSSLSAYIEGLYTARAADFVGSLPGVSFTSYAYVHQYAVTTGLDYSFWKDWNSSLVVGIADQKTRLPTAYLTGLLTDTAVFQYSEQLQGKTRSVDLSANGTAIDGPTGPIRVALGAGYRREYFDDLFQDIALADFAQSRNLSYEFGELAVPLLGYGDVHRPSLELDLSGRHELYSDVGPSTVPKVGLIFKPAPSTKLRASWGKSFRAPTLSDLHAAPLLVLANIPDPLSSSGVSTILLPEGGSINLRPETARSWAVGADFTPELVRGLQVNATYYNTVYESRIGQVGDVFLALTDPGRAAFVTRNPSLQLQQSLVAAYGSAGNFINITGAPYDPATVAAVVDGRNLNIAREDLEGVDLLLDYTTSVRSADLKLFLNQTYLRLRQRVSPTAVEQQLSGLAFDPARFRARAGATWTWAGWSATAIVNYLGRETNIYAPTTAPVASWTTFDAQLSYSPHWFRSSVTPKISASIQNIFDRDPPYLVYDQAVAGFHYDSLNVSPVGRVLSLRLGIEW